MQIDVRRSRLASTHKYHIINQPVSINLSPVVVLSTCINTLDAIFFFFCFAYIFSIKFQTKIGFKKNTVEFEIGYKTNCILFKQKKNGFSWKKSWKKTNIFPHSVSCDSVTNKEMKVKTRKCFLKAQTFFFIQSSSCFCFSSLKEKIDFVPFIFFPSPSVLRRLRMRRMKKEKKKQSFCEIKTVSK